MVGGLISGLHHAEAAHFSFLIATPIIAGAAVRKPAGAAARKAAGAKAKAKPKSRSAKRK